MDAGMSIVRLQMVDFLNNEGHEIIKIIRQAVDRYSKSIGRVYPLPIALELKGPHIRTGSFKDVNLL